MRKKVDSVLEYTLIFIMSVMVINVLWQVFSRYILNAPGAFTDELARYLMIWIGLLGAAYASGKKIHVAIDIIPQKFNAVNQARINKSINYTVALFAFACLVIGGMRLVYITYVLDQYSPSLNVPLAGVYLILPLSGLLIIYYKLEENLRKTHD